MNRTIGSFLIALSTAAVFAGCANDPDAASAAATLDGIVTITRAGGGAPVVASAAWAQVIGAPTTPGLAAAYALASSNADALVASRPTFLHVSPKDAFVRRGMELSSGLVYVPYERTYAGLPVVGGDFVMVIDGAGQLVYHSVAQERPIDLASITPKLSQAAAETVATQRLHSVTRMEGTQLVVNALGPTARLAWETTVNGFGANGISRLTVDVDALTGKVLREQEHVMYGTGTSAWNGPNPVTINTTQSGGTFLMQDPTITNLSCQDAANNTTFSGSDDVWGSTDKTSRETGCVDALFGAQTEARMLTAWLGRNGFDGVGGGWPIRVGLAQVNAFYDGTQVQVGHNNANQWIGTIDVIAHELGHGIDDHTPGGISGGGTQEFVADTFGAATEAFANEPAPFDVPDFTVGEQINLVGTGPIRNMANPSLVNGDPNCFSSAIPTAEVHAAAGPGNHWFYLLAQGSNPTNGFPTSPTCNNSTVVGLGTQTAITILYNAMLLKTTGFSYPKYRTATLQAAKNLFPGSCTQFNTVKAAWDAVSLPAQAGDPTCSSGPDFALSSNPTSRSVVQGSSTTYAITETPAGGFTGSVTLSASGLPTSVTASFSPNPTTGASTLTVTTSTTTPTGTFTITITGTSGTLSHTVTVTLTVTGTGGCGVNLLQNSGFETVGANWTATAGVLGNASSGVAAPHAGTQFAWLDGYGTTHTDTLSQSVTSTCAVSQLCFFLKISTAETSTTTAFDKLTVSFRGTTLGTFSNLNAAAFATYQQRCFTVSGVPSAAAVTFTGIEDSSLQTSFIIDDISILGTAPPNDFSITPNPSSGTVAASASTMYTINTAVVSGAAQTITLSVLGLPTGVTGNFFPASVTAGGSSTLTLAADATATAGMTQFTITGASSSANHTVNASVTVLPNDFSMNLTSPSQTITKITSATYTINTDVTVGVSQGIMLSISGLPAGVTGNFSPTNVTAGGSSRLTLTATAVAVPGTTAFTITGTGTSATHMVNASVTVENPPHWSVSGTPNLLTVDNNSACTSLSVTATGGDSSVAKLDISGSHSNWQSLRGTLAHNGVPVPPVEAFPRGVFGAGSGPFSFLSRPVAGLSGDASGTWELCIIDTDALSDVGVLNTWSVHD